MRDRLRKGGTLRELYRDFVPLVAVVIAGIALHNFDQVLKEQQQGRAIALRIVCAVASEQTEGGRALLLRSAALRGDETIGKPGHDGFRVISGELSRFLEAHGMPGPEERVRSSRAAATAYAIDTSLGVKHEAEALGVTVDDVVRADGSLNCAKLQAVAKAG